MEKNFNLNNFKDLMTLAKDLTEKSKEVLPVFENVRGKLKEVAAKTVNVVEAKAKVSIDSLKNITFTRRDNPLDLDEANPDKNISLVINWIVQLLKSVLEKLDEHGDLIRVHTEALADPKVVLDVAKSDEIDTLKDVNEKLRVDLDETRQRGMKGNILVSSPSKPGKETSLKHKVDLVDGIQVTESDTDMVLRLIFEKTTVTIPKEDVIACHPMGRREKNTYIITIINRKPGSAWERLTACMMKASNMVKEKNVYINFQLTKDRAALAKDVRKAKTDGRIGGYSVDQNGRIKIKKLDGDKQYKKVTSVAEMNGMLEK